MTVESNGQTYGERISALEFGSLGFDELITKLEAMLPSGDLKEACLGSVEKAKAYAQMIAGGDYNEESKDDSGS